MKFETDGGVRVGQNTNDAAGGNSFIGGGVFNRTLGTATTSFIGGGSSNTALGSLSFIAGGGANKTDGTYSFATGLQNRARSYAESVFGTFATIYTPISSTAFDEADRIFVIGNGTTDFNRSNAVTVLKNGNVGIGPNVPTEALEVDGNVKATAFIGDGSGLTGISFTELDGDITNELQTISKSGNTITLSNGGGSFEDADSDATNELQTLELDGVNLKISDGNNVGLPVARLGFDKNDEVQSFPNDDNYRNLAIATINLPLGDYLAISANATVRLTSGSGTDDFIYRIRITGNGCTNDPVDFPEHTYRPDEDSSDHDNFRQIHYQEYYNGVCFGTVTVRFQVKNTGDDPWEAQHSSILLTKTEL